MHGTDSCGWSSADAVVTAIMEARDAAGAGTASVSFSATTQQSLHLLVASSLGLGTLSFLCQAQTRKSLLSAAIGGTYGALKGAKALGDLQFPSPSAFLVISKALIKGYKASKRLNLIRTAPATTRFSSFVSKRVAASLRALNVVRYARSFLHGDGVVGLGFLSSGFKLSKNFLKVLEGFTGNRFDSALRDRFDTVGLLIKVSIIAGELDRIAGRRRKNCRCGFIRNSHLSSLYVLHLKLKRMTADCGFEDLKRFHVEHFAPCGRALMCEQPPVPSLSELLCLSIPLSRQSTLPEILYGNDV